MPLTLAAEPPPLTIDECGRFRVAGTRVFLELLVGDYRRGESAEAIAERYDVLTLADVYGALRYYLTHRAAVDAYVARRDAEAAEAREAAGSARRPFPSRDALLARRTFRTGELAPVGGVWRSRGEEPTDVSLAAGDAFPPAGAGRAPAEWGYVVSHPAPGGA